MKMTEKQIQRFVKLVFKFLGEDQIMVFKSSEGQVIQRAIDLVKGDLEGEQQLDRAVDTMMDQLEESQSEPFERYKMFPLLKKRLAKEKGVVLDERYSHMASLVVDGIWRDDMVDFTDEEIGMKLAKRGANAFEQEQLEIDRVARQMVSSLKRGVMEGTQEWDVMYRKYYEQELQRRGN